MSRARGTTQFEMSLDVSPFLRACEETKEAIAEDIRPAAHAGGTLIYEAVKAATPVGPLPQHWFHGANRAYLFHQGDLRRSIYIAFSKDNSSDYKATYHISWRVRGEKGVPYGYMVHNGTSHARANPFVYNGVNASREAALDESLKAMMESLTKKGWFAP